MAYKPHPLSLLPNRENNMRTHTEITTGFRLVMINALIDAAGNSGRTWHLPWYNIAVLLAA